ncbi:MAG: 50S ribosomal protein L25, partial [Actinomycetota bacterium]
PVAAEPVPACSVEHHEHDGGEVVERHPESLAGPAGRSSQRIGTILGFSDLDTKDPSTMETKLVAERRDGAGKGVARKLRAAGRVPGVLYGHGEDPVSLSVNSRELLHLFLHGGGSNALIGLEIDGSSHLAIPREVQRDHIRGSFIHIDFLAVSRDERIKVTVEVTEFGEAEGVKAGGVVEHHLREVEVECLPGDVPERIEVEITTMALGDMLHVRDLTSPNGVEILTDPDTAVISVITPAALRTEADLSTPGAEGAEAQEAAVEEPAEGAEPAAEGEEAPAEGGES